MKELALRVVDPTTGKTIYGGTTGPAGLNNGFVASPTNGGGLAFFVFTAIQIALYAGGVLMVIWMGWGIFQYIIAGGNKDRLAQARKRIIFAIVGFTIIAIAFAVQGFLKQALNPQSVPVQQIDAPK